jgi:hypothetical protein
MRQPGLNGENTGTTEDAEHTEKIKFGHEEEKKGRRSRRKKYIQDGFMLSSRPSAFLPFFVSDFPRGIGWQGSRLESLS